MSRALVRCALAAAICLLALPAAAAPGWLADARTGCRIWDDNATAPGAAASWSGACVNGLAEGRGVLQTSSSAGPGPRYEGEMRGGKMNGRGTYTWPNGNRYEGEVRDGYFQGQGVQTWTNGDRYEGEWANDVAHGRGTKTKQDGRRYSGTWTNGCFRQGDEWSTVGPTAEQCGFK